MPKPNPYGLQRPNSVTETREFVDPSHPNEPITLTLKAVGDYGFLDEIANLGSEFLKDFIQGRNGGPPAPLPPVQGQDVILTARMCGEIAALIKMEQAEEGESWDIGQWRALSATAPSAFQNIVEWSQELLARARGQLGNSPAVPTE